MLSDLVGCAEDLIKDGTTGLRFTCGDIQGLSDCMRTMAADPEASKRMGEAARRWVEDQFTIEDAARGIREATLRVCQSSRLESGKGRGQTPGVRKEAGQDMLTPISGPLK